MRTLVTVVAALVLLGGQGTSVQAQAPALPCRAGHASLSAAGAVQQRALPHFIEVDLTVQNSGPTPVRIDPARFVFTPDNGPGVAPASRDEVVRALHRPSPVSVSIAGFITMGAVGVSIGVGPFDLQVHTIETRLLRPMDVAPGGIVKGSLYFRPVAWPAHFSVAFEGLNTASGKAMPALTLYCAMPVRLLGSPGLIAQSNTAPRTIPLSARAETGPLAVSVSSIELTRQATTVSVTVENAAATEASLFVAIGQAQLVDAGGKVYAIRMLRSDLPERVGPRSQARGRLVFEPLPLEAAVTSSVFVLPGARVGDDVYDLRVDLRF